MDAKSIPAVPHTTSPLYNKKHSNGNGITGDKQSKLPQPPLFVYQHRDYVPDEMEVQPS